MTPEMRSQFVGLLRQLAAAGLRDGVELGFAVVLGGAPARRDPALMLKPHERRVDGALVQLQGVVADLLDAAGDAVSVQRPHAVERLQHHQIERALQHVDSSRAAGRVLWPQQRSTTETFGMSIGVRSRRPGRAHRWVRR